MISKETVQIVCVAEFHAFEGKTGALMEALHSLIEPTHQEPGCLRYELNQRIDDERWISFVEKWKDKKSFDEHCAMPYIKDYFDNIRPQLVEEFAVKLYLEVLP
jgi:quinol monooxygenase YgiN